MSVVRSYINTHDRISGAGTPVPRRDDELGTAPASEVRVYKLSPEEWAKYPPVRPTRADLVADLEAGLRVPEIAEKWGITEGRVRKLLAIYQRPAETEGDEEMERRAVQLTEAEEVSAPAPAGGGIEWWPPKSEVTFALPEGADWREYLTPNKYRELKDAGWSDRKVIDACGAKTSQFYAWKKEHSLYGVGLREYKRRPDPDPAPPAEVAAAVQPELAVNKEPQQPEELKVETPGSLAADDDDADYADYVARQEAMRETRPPVTCTCGSGCGPVCKCADPGAAPKPKKTPGTNLPEGVRQWSQIISREQMAAVSHLDSREAAARLGIPQYAYKSLKRQYGLARPADRRVLTVTEAAIEAGKLREDLECCRRLLGEIEGLSGGVILALEQLANDARRKLAAIERVKVVI